MTAYTVARRTAEIGIRMALGAGRGSVVAMVLREAMIQAGIGLAIGIPVALLCVRFLKSQLYGNAGMDVPVLIGALVVLLISACVAGLIPAQRAASTDPVKLCEPSRGEREDDFSDKQYSIWTSADASFPGFSLTVVLTMALGVGANVIVFGVLNALVLHPLHLPEANRLMFVNRLAKDGDLSPSQSYPDYRDLRDKNVVFSGLTTVRVNEVGSEYGNRTTKSWIYEASGNYFDVLGVQPLLGRFFTARTSMARTPARMRCWVTTTGRRNSMAMPGSSARSSI